MQRRIVISLGLLVSIFVLIILLMGCDGDSIKLKTDCMGVIETADNYKYSGNSELEYSLFLKYSVLKYPPKIVEDDFLIVSTAHLISYLS